MPTTRQTWYYSDNPLESASRGREIGGRNSSAMLNPQRVFLENYRLAGLPWDLHQNHDAAWDSAPAAPARSILCKRCLEKRWLRRGERCGEIQRWGGRGGTLTFSGHWLLEGRGLVLCSGIHPDFVRTEVYRMWGPSLKKNNKNKIRCRDLKGSSVNDGLKTQVPLAFW